jgi:5-methyltetrahydropteroyltriglutamate--homocysteine methyltransferase
VIQRLGWDRALGLGVVGVKSKCIGSAELIAARIRKALGTFPADKLIINPDCGLRHLPADVARAKLAAMVEERTAAVRRTLPAESNRGPTESTEPIGPEPTPEPTVEQGA